ncbi:nuclease domain-containing protein [Neptuniibacter halophilus]|uniref:nuclease domain-containing protein n=1 Tax=Neptuniibacter halophilus TaxID=651666 RepID=UPI00257386E5|nr:nuclease domain-containing protein [Neptuniibacter halophilus]
MIKSKALRDSARGENCTMRLPGVCNFNPETTVLAHVPCGMGGMGMKGPDQISVYACSSCHDALDNRQPGHHISGWHMIHAIAETQGKMIEKGLVTVKGVKP